LRTLEATSKTSIKYKPLYDLLHVDKALDPKTKLSKEKKEYYKSLSLVDTVILTGGRGSGKSFEVGDWTVEATLQYDFKTLYTRFTNVSMSDSVIPEITEKIENSGLLDYFTFTNNKYYSNCGDGLISFKGIKTGSHGQTANLKSLKGFNVMVTDEAEEIPDYKTFEKVYYSIRSKDKQNLSILLLNPTTKDHWIYQKFFKENGVPDGYNGIKNNVLYIHTSYKDVDPKNIPENIVRSYELMKERSPQDYEHIVMGGWIQDLEGALFKRNDFDYFSLDNFNLENVETVVSFIDVADRGTDSLSMPIGMKIGSLIYIYDWYFTQDNQDITIPEITYKSIETGIQHMAVEVNGVGGGYYESLIKSVGCLTYPFSQQANKHSRIIQNSGFIRNYFVFRNDYESGSMYDKAMRELFNYNKDDKLNRKDGYNDDAPDSITGLWITCKDLFPNDWI